MKDILKYNSIADDLLSNENFVQAYDTYYLVYSEIWAALSKFRNEFSLNGNNQIDELKIIVKESKYNKFFFDIFKMTASKVLEVFFNTIFGRLRCLHSSKSLNDNSSLTLVYNEFLLLYILLDYNNEVKCLENLFNNFTPYSRYGKLHNIEMNKSSQTIKNEILKYSTTGKFILIKKMLMEFMFNAGVHNSKFFEALASSNKHSQSNINLLTEKDFTSFYEELSALNKVFNPVSATEKEKAVHYGKVLGLSGQIKKSEIRNIYHKKVSLYHPDKIKNPSPDTLKRIEDKTKEINQAFDWFKQKYKL